ncbi:MAG: TPM domain-containing protein [Ferruginibacter sp.]
MKHSLYHTTLIFLFTFLLITNCSCQSNIKKENGIQNENRVFDKKPLFDTLLNDFVKPIGYVNDYGGLYTPRQVFEMDSLIYDFESKSSIQLVLVTFDSNMVKSSEIDYVTNVIGNGWKVGGDSSKGIVIGISKPYKRIRIQNGKYVQSILSDSKTKEIIDSSFIPEFRNNHYFEGTLLGLKALIRTLPITLAEKTKVEF